MKALSIKPPWSTMIVAGIKPVENRTWYCSHRGPLLIHSSKTWDKEGAEWICDTFPELKGFINSSVHMKGYIIGKVKMIDCVTKHHSPWFFGPRGFVFSDPIEFARDQAILYKGKRLIFEVPIIKRNPRKG